MDSVQVIAPAKVNLSLDVVGLDDRGYHLLDMIMQTISVFEYITLTKQDEIEIKSNAKYIPTNEKNTAVKAAIKFFEYTGIKSGVLIDITKRIPIKAGMAGGSADAAGVIKGLDWLFKTNLSNEELSKIGLMVGSDVPFMLVGGTKRVKGTGELISNVPRMPLCYFVVCMPSIGVSTPEAFSNYDEMNIKTDIQTEKLISAIKSKDLKEISKYLGNDLEKAAKSKYTDEIKEKLINLGALGSVMTGSGAAVFGIFDSEETAKNARDELKPLYKSVFLAQPVSFGASVKKNK